jgi:RNA polymerase sigma-70 factor (ECF subfamily)
MDEADARAAHQAHLRAFIEHENETLRRTLRVYVARAGITPNRAGIDAAADELLSEVVVEALAHAERFDPARQPAAWLMGIAANLIKRRQVELAKLGRREPLARDMAGESGGALSEDEVFDRVAAFSAEPGDDIETEQRLSALLSPLSEEDKQVVRLAVLHELDGAALARALGIQPGAARVRLHRALSRLRREAISLGVSNG